MQMGSIHGGKNSKKTRDIATLNKKNSINLGILNTQNVLFHKAIRFAFEVDLRTS